MRVLPGGQERRKIQQQLADEDRLEQLMKEANAAKALTGEHCTVGKKQTLQQLLFW